MDTATAQPIVIDSRRPPRGEHPLKAWRTRQLVLDDGGTCRRSMRLLDVTKVYGIPHTTWHGWERWPEEKGFRRPDDVNMKMLFVLTGGEVRPDHFYPIDEWQRELKAEE